MTKLNDSFFPAKFEVDSYTLHSEGMTITYFKGEREMNLLLTPEETCTYFKEVGLIEHFDMHEGTPVIVWEARVPATDYYGTQYYKSDIGWMYWGADFFAETKANVLYNGLTMERIVAKHESRNPINKVLNHFTNF